MPISCPYCGGNFFVGNVDKPQSQVSCAACKKTFIVGSVVQCRCGHCSAAFTVSHAARGKAVNCPHCKQSLMVPPTDRVPVASQGRASPASSQISEKRPATPPVPSVIAGTSSDNPPPDRVEGTTRPSLLTQFLHLPVLVQVSFIGLSIFIIVGLLLICTLPTKEAPSTTKAAVPRDQKTALKAKGSNDDKNNTQRANMSEDDPGALPVPTSRKRPPAPEEEEEDIPKELVRLKPPKLNPFKTAEPTKETAPPKPTEPPMKTDPDRSPAATTKSDVDKPTVSPTKTDPDKIAEKAIAFKADETMRWWVNWNQFLAELKKTNNEVLLKRLQERRQSEWDAAKGKPVEGWVQVQTISIDEKTKSVVVTITIGAAGKDLPVTIMDSKDPLLEKLSTGSRIFVQGKLADDDWRLIDGKLFTYDPTPVAKPVKSK
jgi:hypothetical protein